MLRFLARRTISTLILICGVMVLTFTLARIMPGDPARLIAGARANPETVAAVRNSLGLDQSIPRQFLHYVSSVAEGDFGRSIVTRREISQDMATFLPATLELVFCAALLSGIAGIGLGVLAAIRRSGLVDIGARGTALFGLSVPDFWVGLMLQLLFFSTLGLLPFGGRLDTGVPPPDFVTGFYTVDALIAGDLGLFRQAAIHLVLPSLVLMLPSTAVLIRVTRASMLEVLTLDYIRTARAKGISPLRVTVNHALRTALLPIITVFGLNLGLLISGAVFVELIFDWPGLGRYTANAIAGTDYNAIMAITLVVSVSYTLVNLLVDLSYALIDPRVDLQ